MAFEFDEELQLLGLKVSFCVDGLQEVVYGLHVHVDGDVGDAVHRGHRVPQFLD